MRRLCCFLFFLLALPTMAFAGRTVIFDRPLAYADAAQTPIDPSVALGYNVYVGNDAASVVLLKPVPPLTDARISVSLTDAELTPGQSLCVSSVNASTESSKICVVFEPVTPISVLYLLAD